MIFVPLLHYFKCKNLYSGNEAGMRYLLTPTKRTVPDPEGGEGAEKEEAILAVDIWPDPWALDKTDPALLCYNNGALAGLAHPVERLLPKQ